MENKVPGVEAETGDRIVLNRNKFRQVNVEERYVAFPTSFVNEVNVSYTLKNFNRLRVLNATWTDTVEIDKLKHLRYLNLYNSLNLRTLPDTFFSLWNLQILNLNNCYHLMELPKRMRYMKNLRHLLLDRCYSLSEMPPKIGELTSLKTLTLFNVGRKRGSQLDELEKLNLGGKLEIRHLERVKNHLDAKKANMDNKSWEGDNNASEQQQAWTTMENIVEICISNCPNFSHLPPLGDLPRLKILYLTNLAALEYVMENEEVKDAILFPSLESLNLSSLPNLKGLLKHDVRKIFPNLQRLHVKDSPMLILQSLSSLKELTCSSLNLNSISKLGNLTYLSVGFDTDTRTCITKEILKNLPNLKILVLDNAKEDNLPIEEEGLQGLKSLRELIIYNCDTLTCLPDVWLRQLTSIEKLSIKNCKELVKLIPKEGIVISSLKHLELYELPKMVSLPEGLQHMIPSLQSLDLHDLPQLTSLPDWLPDFISLQHLYIVDCHQLTSLPTTIQGMTNLRRLTISRCPELERRYEKEKGEDWHIIAAIPHLSVRF